MTTIKLWDKTPGMCEEEPVLEYFPAQNRISDATVVIYPGGGYGMRAPHAGKGYAEYFNTIGMDAFVCEYRVLPHRFPLELLDARRAVRWVRHHAAEYGLDPHKVAVMGSSAGGHLAGLVSTYTAPIDFEGIDEVDGENPIPDATLLSEVRAITPAMIESAGGGGTALSTGGMATKLTAARICMDAGIDMMIVNGADPAILYDALDGKSVGTRFIGRK